MYDRIESVVKKLKVLKGKFDPDTLSHIGHGPENRLTL